MNLKYLNISNNAFYSIPSKIHKLINLQEFCLDWFRYVNFPIVQLSTLPSFQKFFLKLQNFPKELIQFEEFIFFFNENKISPIYKKYEKGRTIIHEASYYEDIGVLRASLMANEDSIDELDEELHSPLSLAIQEEKYYSAKILIYNGSNLLAGGSKLGSCIKYWRS